MHDIHFLKDIKNNHENCTVIGDKAYLSVDYHLDLFNSNRIRMGVFMRNNQNEYKPQYYLFKKARIRIVVNALMVFIAFYSLSTTPLGNAPTEISVSFWCFIASTTDRVFSFRLTT